MKIFSSRLREARKKAGLGQVALAEKLGVSSGSVGNWETGEGIPKGEKLKSLSEILGVSQGWLLGDDKPAIQLPEKVNAWAESLRELRGFETVPELLAQLVREEWDRRCFVHPPDDEWKKLTPPGMDTGEAHVRGYYDVPTQPNQPARPASSDSPQPQFVAPPSRRSAEAAKRSTSSLPRSKGQSQEGDNS